MALFQPRPFVAANQRPAPGNTTVIVNTTRDVRRQGGWMHMISATDPVDEYPRCDSRPGRLVHV
jgi:hypothetical protein